MSHRAPKDAIDENDSDNGADRDEATSARDTGDVDGSDDHAVTESQKTHKREPRKLGRDLDAAADAQMRGQKEAVDRRS